jgi:hypothetical protein
VSEREGKRGPAALGGGASRVRYHLRGGPFERPDPRQREDDVQPTTRDLVGIGILVAVLVGLVVLLVVGNIAAQ